MIKRTKVLMSIYTQIYTKKSTPNSQIHTHKNNNKTKKVYYKKNIHRILSNFQTLANTPSKNIYANLFWV